MAGGLHGKNATFTYNSVAITNVTDISGLGVTTATTAEVTAMGDTSVSSKKGIPGGGSFTVSGHAVTGTTDHCGLGTAAAANTTDGLAWSYEPEGAGSGLGTMSGTAHCTAYTQSAAFGGAITWAAKFEITGDITFGAQS